MAAVNGVLDMVAPDQIREAVARALRDQCLANGVIIGFAEDFTDAALAAHTRALADAGLVIVPREPTERMHQAGTNGMFDPDEFGPVATIWRAMVAKAEEEMDEK